MSAQPSGRELVAAQIAGKPGAQRALAKKVKCSESHLSLWLDGKRELSVLLARRLARATGVPMIRLLPADIAKALAEGIAA